MGVCAACIVRYVQIAHLLDAKASQLTVLDMPNASTQQSLKQNADYILQTSRSVDASAALTGISRVKGGAVVRVVCTPKSVDAVMNKIKTSLPLLSVDATSDVLSDGVEVVVLFGTDTEWRNAKKKVEKFALLRLLKAAYLSLFLFAAWVQLALSSSGKEAIAPLTSRLLNVTGVDVVKTTEIVSAAFLERASPHLNMLLH